MLNIEVMEFDKAIKRYSHQPGTPGFAFCTTSLTNLMNKITHTKGCYSQLINSIEDVHWENAGKNGSERDVCFISMNFHKGFGIAIYGTRDLGPAHAKQTRRISTALREVFSKEYENLSDEIKKTVDTLLKDYEENGCNYIPGFSTVYYDDGTTKDIRSPEKEQSFADEFADIFEGKNPFKINYAQQQEKNLSKGQLFYIENTLNERGNVEISGYFSSFDKALEGLKDCCDWYRSHGTGKIYQVDTDVLNPDPVLVCKDGVIEPEFVQVFGKNEELSFNLNSLVVDDDGFKGKVVAFNPEANMYLINHETVDGRLPAADGWYPPERLKSYEQGKEEKNKSSLDSIISRAQAISEQSKSLADDLSKHKNDMQL